MFSQRLSKLNRTSLDPPPVPTKLAPEKQLSQSNLPLPHANSRPASQSDMIEQKATVSPSLARSEANDSSLPAIDPIDTNPKDKTQQSCFNFEEIDQSRFPDATFAAYSALKPSKKQRKT